MSSRCPEAHRGDGGARLAASMPVTTTSAAPTGHHGAPVQLLLVRHGHAGTKEGWADDDRLRPLDARGRRQAKHLVGVVAPMHPTRLLSSPYARCLQTMEPVAAKTGWWSRKTRASPPTPDRRRSSSSGPFPHESRHVPRTGVGTVFFDTVSFDTVSFDRRRQRAWSCAPTAR